MSDPGPWDRAENVVCVRLDALGDVLMRLQSDFLATHDVDKESLKNEEIYTVFLKDFLRMPNLNFTEIAAFFVVSRAFIFDKYFSFFQNIIRKTSDESVFKSDGFVNTGTDIFDGWTTTEREENIKALEAIFAPMSVTLQPRVMTLAEAFQ